MKILTVETFKKAILKTKSEVSVLSYIYFNKQDSATTFMDTKDILHIVTVQFEFRIFLYIPLLFRLFHY